MVDPLLHANKDNMMWPLFLGPASLEQVCRPTHTHRAVSSTCWRPGPKLCVAWQESELVEARLERSQAQAKAQRAQQRLDDLLAEQPAAQVLPMHEAIHPQTLPSCVHPSLVSCHPSFVHPLHHSCCHSPSHAVIPQVLPSCPVTSSCDPFCLA